MNRENVVESRKSASTSFTPLLRSSAFSRLKQQLMRLLIFCFCPLFWFSQPGIGDHYPGDDHLFKAAFIFNFARLTSWPENTWGHQDESLTLCTTGKDTVVNDLNKLGGKIIKGHPVVIRSLEIDQNFSVCQLLYIASSETKRVTQIIQSVSDKPVLTVSEVAGFVEAGGIIELYREEQRTRFLINLGVARKLDLEISSRLLSLAKVVGNLEQP